MLLGLSGGVDSAACAILLQRQGYEVIGATMSIWDGRLPNAGTARRGCFGPGEKDSLASARSTCDKLGIRHVVVKLQEEFAREVLGYFCSTYLAGRTPNPCVACNACLKFGHLPQKARELGIEFDYFATGHYVRSRYSDSLGRWQLLTGSDAGKDQSYFLCFLDQSQLATTLFPLGGLTKAEARALAASEGLKDLAARRESQDFISMDDAAELFAEGSYEPGALTDPEGRVLGKHRGLIHYTVGQRKNLGLSGMPEPWYVIRLETAANLVVVGPKNLLYGDKLTATAINWVSVAPPTAETKATAKLRLGHQAAPCRILPGDDSTADVIFDQPQLSITPGQAVVFYDGEILTGGGIIN